MHFFEKSSQSRSKAAGLTFCAAIAALYVVTSLAIPTLSFGVIQLRLGEIFTLFAAASPLATVGLTLGCFLTNLIGLCFGITFAPDLLFGTLATLLGGIGSWLLRNIRVRRIPILIWLPPVFFNALLVGLELTWFLVSDRSFSWPVFWVTGGWVALSETICCLILGMPFYLFVMHRFERKIS